jgi:hypothetical protein
LSDLRDLPQRVGAPDARVRKARRKDSCSEFRRAGPGCAYGRKDRAEHLRFAYDLALAQARDWGLFISTSRGVTSIGIEEPALFSEPGLFLVNPDQTLYYMSVQSMPFVRPHLSELLGALDFAIDKNYPARGEYTGAL